MHHRSPDQPGKRWVRTATAEELSALPGRMTDAFPLIEIATYQLAQDAEGILNPEEGPPARE